MFDLYNSYISLLFGKISACYQVVKTFVEAVGRERARNTRKASATTRWTSGFRFISISRSAEFLILLTGYLRPRP